MNNVETFNWKLIWKREEIKYDMNG